MSTAKEIRKIEGFTGDARLFELSADEQGEILNWSELEGSYHGGLDHERALERAGYEVVK